MATSQPASPACACNVQAIGNAASVPNVPGAKGMSPVPKPSAMKCAGCRTRNASDGAPIDVRMRALFEMVVAARQRRQRLTVLVADDEVRLRGDPADRRQRQSERQRNRVDASLCGSRYREAQLVVVASGQHATQCELALRPGKPRAQFVVAGDRGQIERRTDARRREDMAKIAGESVR